MQFPTYSNDYVIDYHLQEQLWAQILIFLNILYWRYKKIAKIIVKK